MKRTVLIIYNKLSENASEDELDVLEQAKLVTGALVTLGYKVKELQVDLNLDEAVKNIRKINPYIVFNLAETINNKGEFAYLGPAILQSMNIPYTGNPLVPLFIAANKVLTKKELQRLGIPTPSWVSIDEIKKIRKDRKYILKPIWEEGSLGLDEDSIFEGSDKSFLAKLKEKNKNYFFIEEFIEGREFNVSVIGTETGPEVLPIAEMQFLTYPENKPRIMGYTAKWKEESFEYTHTLRTFKIPASDKDIIEKMRTICKKCWNEIGFKGYVRIDFRMDADRIPKVIDLNLNPCISESGGFIAANKQAGYSFAEVIDRILKEALRC